MASEMTIAHLSDPHIAFALPRRRDLIGKRALTRLSWKRRRGALHRRDLADILCADCLAARPDFIAVTGDIVNFALESEFAASRRWLETLGSANRVAVVPGNHESLVSGMEEVMHHHWRGYLGGDADEVAVSFAFPWSRRFAHFAYWAIDPNWSPLRPDQLVYGSDKGGVEYEYSDDPDDPGRLSDPIFLWLVERDGLDPYILNASAALGITQEDPDFDPTGTSVVFTAREDVGATQIWTLNLDTAEADKLVGGQVSDPAWSPDGDSIAFVEQDDSGNNIWIVPSDGGEPYALTTGLDCVGPEWAPDGSGLAFIELVDSAFRVSFLPVSRDGAGRLTAGEPRVLFTADDIDAPSGLSWHASQ